MAINSGEEARLLYIWRKMIEELGGTWVGVQTGFSAAWDPLSLSEDPEPLIMFTRVGSTTLLSIPVSKMTPEAVAEKLGKKVTPVQEVESVQVRQFMKATAIRLRILADEIEEEMKNV